MSEPRTRAPSLVDFRVPAWGVFLFIMAMLGQTAALITWGAKLDERVSTLEKQQASYDKMAESVARIDERTNALVVTVNRMADERGK